MNAENPETTVFGAGRPWRPEPVSAAAAGAKIANAGVVFMAMVVGCHVAGRAFPEGTAMWWLERFGHRGLFLAAVPFFFACSGYFLAGHVSEGNWYPRECGKRVRSILVPAFCFSVIWFAVIFGIAFVRDAVMGRAWFAEFPADAMFWARFFWLYPFEYPRIVPHWYLRSLMLLVLVSPAIVRLLAKFGAGLPAFLFVGWVLHMIINAVKNMPS